MGTRGLIGIRKKGVLKGTYNHFDSYPSCLGDAIASEIKSKPIGYFEEGFDRIKMVVETAKPTKAEIAKCKDMGLYDETVSQQRETDWYCLLKKAQGSLIANIEAGLMIDEARFMADSLFCEWAYVLDLDKKELEIYRGFNKLEGTETKVRSDGSTYTTDKYGPVRLLYSVPLDELESFDMETFEKAYYATCEFLEPDEDA